MEPIVFAMPGNEAMADGICRARGWERGAWESRRFPDGESYVRYDTTIAQRDIAIVCTLSDPDPKAIALYLAACVARELGARRIGLVIPYLAYMRQDASFQAGEGVTCRHFARLLSGVCDWLVTVDPHLHRVHQLGDVYSVATSVVAAAPDLAHWIAARIARPLLVGPDEESEQWVAQVAATVGCPHIVLQKTRSGDREVSVSVPGVESWRDHTPVLVDDIASTARTMIAAAARLREAGMRAPWCVAVHAIFGGHAYDDLIAAGVAGVASTNTVLHQSNSIDIAASIGSAMAAHRMGSVA
jgi:ribose-phosphate pyrophosphokinase